MHPCCTATFLEEACATNDANQMLSTMVVNRIVAVAPSTPSGVQAKSVGDDTTLAVLDMLV